MLYIILPVLLSAITWYVHKHTYDGWDYDYKGNAEPLPLYMWQVILAVIVYSIPIVNLVVFTVGAGVYFVMGAGRDIVFNDNSLNPLFTFLNQKL